MERNSYGQKLSKDIRLLPNASKKKENNTDSYACALRDVGREYACIDSLSRALKILTIADSVARNTKNIEVTASIDNALGNIYAMQNKYDKRLKNTFSKHW